MLPLLLIAEVFKLEQKLNGSLAPSPSTWVKGDSSPTLSQHSATLQTTGSFSRKV